MHGLIYTCLYNTLPAVTTCVDTPGLFGTHSLMNTSPVQTSPISTVTSPSVILNSKNLVDKQYDPHQHFRFIVERRTLFTVLKT